MTHIASHEHQSKFYLLSTNKIPHFLDLWKCWRWLMISEWTQNYSCSCNNYRGSKRKYREFSLMHYFSMSSAITFSATGNLKTPVRRYCLRYHRHCERKFRKCVMMTYRQVTWTLIKLWQEFARDIRGQNWWIQYSNMSDHAKNFEGKKYRCLKSAGLLKPTKPLKAPFRQVGVDLQRPFPMSTFGKW